MADHFIKVLGRMPTCPICATSVWMLNGVHYLSEYDTTLNKPGEDTWGRTEPVLPVAVLICRKCYHVLQFAWLPLKDGAKDNGK